MALPRLSLLKEMLAALSLNRYSADQNALTEININTEKTEKMQFLIKINDLKIIYFCTFVILFTIGNLLILLSYKLRDKKNKVKLLLAFNILSFLLMKVYCKSEMEKTESSPLGDQNTYFAKLLSDKWPLLVPMV